MSERRGRQIRSRRRYISQYTVKCNGVCAHVVLICECVGRPRVQINTGHIIYEYKGPNGKNTLSSKKGVCLRPNGRNENFLGIVIYKYISGVCNYIWVFIYCTHITSMKFAYFGFRSVHIILPKNFIHY